MSYCVTVSCLECLDSLDRNSLYLHIYGTSPSDLLVIDGLSAGGGRYYDIFHDAQLFRVRWREATYGLFDGYDWCWTVAVGEAVSSLITTPERRCNTVSLVIYSPDYRKVRAQLFKLVDHLEARVGDLGYFHIERSKIVLHFRGLAMRFVIALRYTISPVAVPPGPVSASEWSSESDGAIYDGNVSKITVSRLTAPTKVDSAEAGTDVMSYTGETMDSFGRRIGKCMLHSSALKAIYRDYSLTIQCRPLKRYVVDAMVGELRNILDIKYVDSTADRVVVKLCCDGDEILLRNKNICKDVVRGFIMRHISPQTTEIMRTMDGRR